MLTVLSRFTSYFIIIALVGLFDFLQNGGAIPLQDIPFVVDIGLALGWSISHQPVMERQIGRVITQAVPTVAVMSEQVDEQLDHEQGRDTDLNVLEQNRQVPSRQTNQRQFMPHQ